MRPASLLCAALLAGAAAAAPEPPRTPSPSAPNLRLQGDARFQDETAALLSRLEKTVVGARMLAGLGATGRSVAIRPGRLERSGSLMMPLAGGDAVILFDPSFSRPGLPPLLVLHHECLHALHWAAEGGAEKEAEEARTLGIGRFASDDLSENALRRELGLPSRNEH